MKNIKKIILSILLFIMLMPVAANAKEGIFEKVYDAGSLKYGKTNYNALYKMDNLAFGDSVLTINFTHENELKDDNCESDYCLVFKQYDKSGNLINDLYLQYVVNYISPVVIDNSIYLVITYYNMENTECIEEHYYYCDRYEKTYIQKINGNLQLEKSYLLDSYATNITEHNTSTRIIGLFLAAYNNQLEGTEPRIIDGLPCRFADFYTINYEDNTTTTETYEYFDFYQIHEEDNKIVVYSNDKDYVFDKNLTSMSEKNNTWREKYYNDDYSFNLSDPENILTSGTIVENDDKYIAFLKENEKKVYQTDDYYTFLFPIKINDHYIVLALSDKIESDILIIKDGKVIQTISGNYWNLRAIKGGFAVTNLGVGIPYYLGNVSGSQEVHSEVFYQKYSINTKTDGNGTIEVIGSAFGGDLIQFKVSAKKGLKLEGITITTDSGEKVEFDKDDITTDSSGVLSISMNKFTMPYENVTIEARWASSIINPNTGTGVSVIIITIVLLVSSITYIILKRKKNYIIK